MQLPKISIVTPSYNQGAFIEETIRSVLDQSYPCLEYIVIDGGSTDGTLNIISKYAEQLAYFVSELDNGQAEALNKGFKRATGDIIGYLNSDDVYLPGTLLRVAEEFSINPNCRWLSGGCFLFGLPDSHGLLSPRGFQSPAESVSGCFIPQPAVFWQRELFNSHGFFDDTYRYAMDWEFWVRLSFRGERCHFIDQPLAAFRLHPSSKSVAEQKQFRPENSRLRREYIKRLSWSQAWRARYLITLERARSARGSFLRYLVSHLPGSVRHKLSHMRGALRPLRRSHDL